MAKRTINRDTGRFKRRKARASKKSSSSPSKSSSKKSSGKISFEEFKRRATAGQYGKATITKRSGGTKGAEITKITKSPTGRVSVVKSDTRTSPTRRVLQGGAIFEVNTQTGGFRRVRLTSQEAARRERLRTGRATARDIVPRLQAGQTQEQRGRTILRRARTVQLRERERAKPKVVRKAAKAPTTAQIASIAKVPVASIKDPSKLTASQIGKLQARANAINKRGKELTQQEVTFVNFIQQIIRKQKQRVDTSLEKLPKQVSSLAKIGTSASAKLNKKIGEIGVGLAYTPARVAQAIDKSLFTGQVGVTSALRNDFKQFLSNSFKENKRVSPTVQASLKQAFKDPTTYIFALVGARTSPKIKTTKRPVIINKPKSASPTAIALKNRIIIDKTSKRTYYINNRGFVARLTVKNNKPTLTYPKIKEFNFKRLGFQNKKQYNTWVKLNTQSKTASGKALARVEKSIIALENKIVTAKNRAILTAAKSKLLNLKKARVARSKGLPPKLTISKAAQKRATLAKTKQLKAKKTVKQLKRKGFKNLAEQKQARKFGFTTKRQLTSFKRVVERASRGSKAADAQVLARFQKISKTKAAARKAASKIQKETLALKKTIKTARKTARKPKPTTKQQIVKIIQSAKIKGKRAQLTLDQALFKIRLLKKRATKTRTGLKLRTAKKLSFQRYRLTLSPVVVSLLGGATARQYNQIRNIPAIVTPRYAEILANTIINVQKDIIKNIDAQKRQPKILEKYVQPTKQIQKVVSRPKPRAPARRATRATAPKPAELPKLPELPKRKLLSVANPKGFDVYITKAGKLTKINKKAYTKAGAAKFGRWLVNNSVARSFKTVGVSRKGTALPKFVRKTPSKLFRQPKPKTKLSPKSFVEKRKYAINTLGERKGLKASQILKRVRKPVKRKKRATIKRKPARKAKSTSKKK